ncbi:MAG: hypothetical protein ACOVQ5_08200 [Flavobacteriales bacterium]|jgi:hypothetical protein
MDSNTTFPQFRRLSNCKNYYKVHSSSEMTEVGTMGGKYWINEVKATILPERVMIADILDAAGDMYDIIEAEAFDSFVSMCAAEKERIYV